MKSSSRRQFLRGHAGWAAAAAVSSVPTAARAAEPPPECGAETASLNGSWQFRRDGEAAWKTVTVPHTWQIAAESSGHYGVSWYERSFDARKEWADRVVRLEFEAVFHSATVWINDQKIGEHLRKGYTAFAFDVTPHLRFGARNTIRVQVDNHFDDQMLPRGHSSDWAHDGGIYRPVTLHVTPKVYVERVEIDADPDLATGDATLQIRAIVRNGGSAAADGAIGFHVDDDETGLTALDAPAAGRYSLKGGESRSIPLAPAKLSRAKLWHFDHPHLYCLRLRLGSGHELFETFGVRKIETRDAAFYLNGERVRLMGVERMAGSNPEFGMAEPSSWIDHDHADLRELNCVYTRVHWPQDRRVLDYCDRHGIFIQTEVPTWGPNTFAGMGPEPSAAILENGIEQLTEMVGRDRNHPCIFSWGVCNEIGGQNPPAYGFAKRMYEESKKLDPKRLVSYASNSLRTTPEKDVSGVMDYVMFNEYYESWYPGTPTDLGRNLDEIHRVFPGKAIVISEYGYCACTPERPEGDSRRIEVLLDHTRVCRERDYIAGLIFFCYNDYRTHVGDQGRGVMQQRVHGVVDLYGARKPSYDVLRNESAPVDLFEVKGTPAKLAVTLRSRRDTPAYRLTGYTLRAVVYGFGDIPVERFEAPLPELNPGQQATVALAIEQKSPARIRLDVLRPDGCSAYTHTWKP